MSADVHADAYFAIVPEWVLDSGVSGNAVKLYAILRRYADNATGLAHPSRRTLAKRMHKQKPETVDPMIRELVSIGAIEVFERRTESGDQDSNGYRVRSVSPGEVVPKNGPRVAPFSGPRVAPKTGDELEPLELEPVEPENTMASAFDEAWGHWPKKRQRKPAWEKFERLVRSRAVPVEALVAAITAHGDAYTAGGYPEQFVPGLVPWLNQERWNDPLPQPRHGRMQERQDDTFALIARMAEEDARDEQAGDRRAVGMGAGHRQPSADRVLGAGVAPAGGPRAVR